MPLSTTLSDAALIEQSRRDPEVFALLFDRHAAHIHRYVARRLGDDTADDVVSETFLAAFRQRLDYDTSRAEALPWLYGIATNFIRRHRRAEIHRYKAYSKMGVLPDGGDAAEQAVERASAHAVRRPLARALASLKARDRDVLLLVAWAELTYEEVAGALSIPIGTVRSRLNRARAVVREALGSTDPTTEQTS
ncbi:DNA-directed RNA polymerase sigma-70 factor [Microbispora rosea subsp. aerata]|nr:RNA polymerase sigma factor [Microbispora rosea]GGO29404.1 DNA-directed RNA polymerase sigma-70 factor [Microbispora rosea subsp. aerata]GIH58918.1 DNA-directed RNA polymerase sigma-70 factor [Microbispora rosea subsp. aerata]GLJ85895.1 DNA-directed RNA polymerase sigma-70 factor [Microbispora rosea subsp. aerata]